MRAQKEMLVDARDNDPNVNVGGHDDPLMQFVYQEAVRGLLHQQNVVEGLNTRAGNLIFASAFATSLLGSKALSDGIERWDWIAMTLLFGIGILTAFMLWPYYNYSSASIPRSCLPSMSVTTSALLCRRSTERWHCASRQT